MWWIEIFNAITTEIRFNRFSPQAIEYTLTTVARANRCWPLALFLDYSIFGSATSCTAPYQVRMCGHFYLHIHGCVWLKVLRWNGLAFIKHVLNYDCYYINNVWSALKRAVRLFGRGEMKRNKVRCIKRYCLCWRPSGEHTGIYVFTCVWTKDVQVHCVRFPLVVCLIIIIVAGRQSEIAVATQRTHKDDSNRQRIVNVCNARLNSLQNIWNLCMRKLNCKMRMWKLLVICECDNAIASLLSWQSPLINQCLHFFLTCWPVLGPAGKVLCQRVEVKLVEAVTRQWQW